ncbi:MAG: DNA polymerase III subunit beta [Planctomycetaceae bacterium]
MKLQCSRQSLFAALQAVSGVVPTRTPKEILKNVKLKLADGKATLLGTDQEVGIRHEMSNVETDSVGDVLLPTQRLISILREVQDETIAIEATEDALWIRTGRSEFRLSIEDPAEFPDVAEFSGDSYIVVNGRQLRQAIQRTAYSADVESTRYALGGVLVEVAGDKLTLAATDSRRLAVNTTVCGMHGEDPVGGTRPVIPAKAMQLIERSIQDDDQEVHLAFHANDVLVRSGASTVYARLVEGRFPRYQDVIPRDFSIVIDLVVGPFLSAVRQSMIVTNEESRGVDFKFADGVLVLDSSGNDIGTSRVEVPVSYDGEPLAITSIQFAEFLSDASLTATSTSTAAKAPPSSGADETHTCRVGHVAKRGMKCRCGQHCWTRWIAVCYRWKPSVTDHNTTGSRHPQPLGRSFRSSLRCEAMVGGTDRAARRYSRSGGRADRQPDPGGHHQERRPANRRRQLGPAQ